jgi:HAMP domain-containing protein
MWYSLEGIRHVEIVSYTKPGAERKNLNYLLRYALVAYLYYLSRLQNEPIVLVSRATNAVSAYALAKKIHKHTDKAEFNRLAKNKAALTQASIRELYGKLRKENAAFDNNGLTISMVCDNANSQNAHIYFNQLIIDSGTAQGLHCVDEATTRKTRELTDVFTGGKSRVRKTIRRKRA